MKHSFSNPDSYSTNSNLQYVFAHEILKKSGLKKHNSVLDIGCGDGRISADISKMVPMGLVLGTDISSLMISYATEQHVPSSHKNLGFMPMDAESNIFSNQFDIVVSFCCLHWVKDQLSALKGIKKALKPDGKAILLVPLRHDELYTAIENVTSTNKWNPYFQNFTNPHQFFSIDQYRNLLNTSNLIPSIFSQTVMEYFFDTKENMEDFLSAWLPHIHEIPNNLQSDFMKEIGNEFLKLVPQTSENKVKMPLQMLQVHASPRISYPQEKISSKIKSYI